MKKKKTLHMCSCRIWFLSAVSSSLFASSMCMMYDVIWRMDHSHHEYVFRVCWKVLRARQIPILSRLLCEITKLFSKNGKESQTVEMCSEKTFDLHVCAFGV